MGVPSDPNARGRGQTSTLDERLEDLLEEEGVAARPPEEKRAELANHVGIHAERDAHQLVYLIQRQRLESAQLADPERHEGTLGLDELEASVPLRVVVRAEDQDRLTLALPREEVEQVERGLVRPLEILEDAQQGGARGVALEELGEVPHEARAHLVRLARRSFGFEPSLSKCGEQVA